VQERFIRSSSVPYLSGSLSLLKERVGVRFFRAFLHNLSVDTKFMQPVYNQTLYKVSSSEHYFYAGRIGIDRQVLMGTQLPNLTCVEFDAAGNYLRAVTKQVPLDDDAVPHLQAWQGELGLAIGPIFVKGFFLQEQWIGIKDLPDHYQEAMNAVSGNHFDGRLKQLQEEARAWQSRRDFVLYWDEEYYLNRQGEVESS